MSSSLELKEGTHRPCCVIEMQDGKPIRYWMLPHLNLIQEIQQTVYGHLVTMKQCEERLAQSIQLLQLQHGVVVPPSCKLTVQIIRSMYRRIGQTLSLASQELVMEIVSIDGNPVPRIEIPMFKNR